jgi:hypothetical protein
MCHPSDPLTIVRAYHGAWTRKDFAAAMELLADELEVPINAYPSKESFGVALAGFGGPIETANLLAEMSAGNEVMQLYDMRVNGMGELRVVEHFTVGGDQIFRLREIYDTAVMREGPS